MVSIWIDLVRLQNESEAANFSPYTWCFWGLLGAVYPQGKRQVSSVLNLSRT